MSKQSEPSTFRENAHPRQEDCAAHLSAEPDYANNPLIMHVDLSEKCRKKRESLPLLPPCEPVIIERAPEKELSLFSRMARALHAKGKDYIQSLIFPADAVVVRCNEIKD
ncbi:hypothetical protein ROA7450_01455 [Roseovarius albus]|uniref:Uncharacterized protein n=1 Tax=Roseovarius albus TaxID=1247867 RepID=A0A1X6YUZ2_9RHOB|nr:hypothetical protein [Roseovarius albus]SLN32183.1 hypothetical protein ROA7450_01455 [Roseovarius albus]